LNFKGQGAEKYKAFMQDNSVNATYVLLQIGKDLKDYIENIKTGFLEFESNETGKVSSSRVEDIKTSFGEILKSVSVDIEDLVSNESKAAEYISVKSTNTNNITDGFSTIDTNLETVNNDFKTKDGETKHVTVTKEQYEKVKEGDNISLDNGNLEIKNQ